jgi:hypothetical protein
MAKNQYTSAADAAIAALMGQREATVRGLADALAAVSAADEKIAALQQQRDSDLLVAAQQQFDAAKTAGWKPKELADFGLAVPAPILPRKATKPATPAPQDQHHD